MTRTTAKAVKQESAFRLSCEIRCTIDASPARIWTLLTDAADFPRWNSTVTSLRGPIAQGQKLSLTVTAAPGRTFTPRVAKLDPERAMEWSDGMAPLFKGVRSFTLTAKPDGTTEFSMVEVFSGIMLPLIKRSLPDFGPSFETYAADLKREAERR